MKLNKIILKVIAWRAVAIITVFLTLWFITGDVKQSTGVTIIVQIVQTLANAVFEVLWEKANQK